MTTRNTLAAGLLAIAALFAACSAPKGPTALHRAVGESDVEEVQGLLQAGADLEARDEHGRTPLHLAAETLGYAAMKTAEALDGNGEAALRHGALSNNAAVLEALLKAGADPGARERDGRTPLHMATLNYMANWAVGSFSKHPELFAWYESALRVLTGAGADAGARDAYGRTSLHYAAMRGHAGIVKVLIEAGSDLSAKDEGGETPRDWAEEEGHAEVAELLRRAGG